MRKSKNKFITFYSTSITTTEYYDGEKYIYAFSSSSTSTSSSYEHKRGEQKRSLANLLVTLSSFQTIKKKKKTHFLKNEAPP
jgi:hypothetical protein